MSTIRRSRSRAKARRCSCIGAAQEPQRVDRFAILSPLGHGPVASVGEAEARIDDRLLAPVPLSVLSGPLARLIDVRLAVGVRNCGHTIAKLLLPSEVPGAAACRLIAVTHPGVEGEPVVRHAPQPVEQIAADGSTVTHLMGDGEKDLELPGRAGAASVPHRGALQSRGRRRPPRLQAGALGASRPRRNSSSAAAASPASSAVTVSAGLWLTPPAPQRTNIMPTSVTSARIMASWPAPLGR